MTVFDPAHHELELASHIPGALWISVGLGTSSPAFAALEQELATVEDPALAEILGGSNLTLRQRVEAIASSPPLGDDSVVAFRKLLRTGLTTPQTTAELLQKIDRAVRTLPDLKHPQFEALRNLEDVLHARRPIKETSSVWGGELGAKEWAIILPIALAILFRLLRAFA